MQEVEENLIPKYLDYLNSASNSNFTTTKDSIGQIPIYTIREKGNSTIKAILAYSYVRDEDCFYISMSINK